jgi:hypothetical protein
VFSLFVEQYAQRDDRVIVELAPVADHSLLVLTHELSLANPEERFRIQREWAIVLDRLEALCTQGGVSRGASWRSALSSTSARVPVGHGQRNNCT